MSMAASRCRRSFALALIVAAACGSDGGGLSERNPPEDPTTGASMTTTLTTTTTADESGTTGIGAEGECAEDGCATGLVCRAHAVLSPSPMQGELFCGECIGLDQAALWCRDASECCDATHVCELGLCHPPHASTTATTDTGSSSGSDSTSGDSSSSGSSSDSSSSDSSSDSGSSTSGSTGA